MTDNIEITYQYYSPSEEWEFRADIRCVLHNPTGDDVVAVRTYKARPKYDELVHNEDSIHEHTSYWWTGADIWEGDGPFTDAQSEWEPSATITDDEALMDECLMNATYDPMTELESLRQNLQQNQRLLVERLG